MLVLVLFIITCLLINFEQYISRKSLTLGYLFLLYGFLYSIGPIVSNDISLVNGESYGLLLFSIVIYTYICSLMCRLFLFSRNNIIQDVKRINLRYSILLATMLICFLVFVYVVLIEVGFVSFVMTSRSSRALITREFGPLMLFKDVVCAVAVYSLVLYYRTAESKFRKLWLLGFLFSVTYAVLTISRTHLAIVVLPSLYVYAQFNNVNRLHINLIFLGGIIIALMWKSVVSNIIFNSDLDLLSNVHFSVPSELYQWAIITENTRNENLLLGTSFLDAAMSLVHPFYNAEPLSVWYVNTYEPLVAERGGGRGFSLLAEVLINFGYVGIPITYGFLGFCLSALSFLSRKYIFFIYSCAVIMPYMHRLFRSELLSITKTLWWFYIVPVVIIVICCKLGLSHVRNNQRRL